MLSAEQCLTVRWRASGEISDRRFVSSFETATKLLIVSAEGVGTIEPASPAGADASDSPLC